MRVAAAVLTHNPVKHGRLEQLDATIESLREADAVYLIDNGSTDGFDRPVSYRNASTLTTSGMGTNLQARILQHDGAGLCVHSDDDVDWHPGWRERLEAWWASCPRELVLTGCHLEDQYPWNGIIGTVTYGGETGLLRESTGAATWSYRADAVNAIFPIPSSRQGWGDVPACRRIREHGGFIGQLDLAEEANLESTWGNQTHDRFGRRLDNVRRLLCES